VTQPPPYPGDLGPDPHEQPTYNVAPPSPGQPKSAHSLGIAAMSIAAVFAAFEVIEAALAWPAQNRILDAAEAGERLDFTTPYDVMAVLWLPLLVTAYVVTCLWLFQARKNVEVLRPHALQARKRGWVWAGWLVPFVSLVFPFQVVRDVLIHPLRPSQGEKVLGFWWAAFLIGNFVERIGLRVINGSSDADSFAALGPVETVNALLMVLALIFWLRIIRTISREQDEEISGLAAG
jgi:hypothetical protein